MAQKPNQNNEKKYSVFDVWSNRDISCSHTKIQERNDKTLRSMVLRVYRLIEMIENIFDMYKALDLIPSTQPPFMHTHLHSPPSIPGVTDGPRDYCVCVKICTIEYSSNTMQNIDKQLSPLNQEWGAPNLACSILLHTYKTTPVKSIKSTGQESGEKGAKRNKEGAR